MFGTEKDEVHAGRWPGEVMKDSMGCYLKGGGSHGGLRQMWEAGTDEPEQLRGDDQKGTPSGLGETSEGIRSLAAPCWF